MNLLLTALVANIVKPTMASDAMQAQAPSTPKKAPPPPAIFSPIPTPSAELHTCLTDFAIKKKIDMLASESKFVDAGMTPDIIPKVKINRLMELTGSAEGPVWALQAFCEDWVRHLAEKKVRTESD